MREEEGLPEESEEERSFREEVRKWLAGAGLAPAVIGGLVSPWADHAEAAVVDARAFQHSLYEAGFVSAVHTNADIAATVAAAREALIG